jgi:hypothetical protein
VIVGLPAQNFLTKVDGFFVIRLIIGLPCLDQEFRTVTCFLLASIYNNWGSCTDLDSLCLHTRRRVFTSGFSLRFRIRFRDEMGCCWLDINCPSAFLRLTRILSISRFNTTHERKKYNVTAIIFCEQLIHFFNEPLISFDLFFGKSK